MSYFFILAQKKFLKTKLFKSKKSTCITIDFSDVGYTRNRFDDQRAMFKMDKLPGRVRQKIYLQDGAENKEIECALHCFNFVCAGFKINQNKDCVLYN